MSSARYGVAVLCALLAGACGRCGAQTASPRAAEAPSDASETSDASHPSSDAGADADAADAAEAKTTSECGPTLLQPNVCASAHADLVLDNDAIHVWFTARGATMREYTFERCREAVFGPEEEHVLVCIDMTPRVIDPELGIAGPVEHRYELEVVSTRGKRRVELLRLPFALGSNGTDLSMFSEMLFSARYSLDAPAGTVDVLASPEECAAALGMLKPYWHAQSLELRGNESITPPAFKQQLLRAFDLERASDAERITATCRAAGHYVRARDGHLVKAPR